MLDPQLVKALSKVYKYDNSELNFDEDVWTYTKPKNLSKKHDALLTTSHFEINRISQYRHEELEERLRHIVKHDDLEMTVANLLVKAIGSGFHRGIQPILSYYFAKHLPQHIFESFNYANYDVAHHCKICGLSEVAWGNDSLNLYHLYIGYLNLESNPFLLLDLEEVLTFQPQDMVATEQDKAIFLNVIKVIEQAPADETLSALEKRLSKEKCLPNSNQSTRLRVLWCFAELGILNNRLVPDFSIIDNFYSYAERYHWEVQMHKRFPATADPVFPASMWQGNLGVNRAYVDRIIDIAHLN